MDRLGGAVPSPAAAFLLTMIALPSLFWLVTLKRTTEYTRPEEWLMSSVMPGFHAWVHTHLLPLDVLFLLISAMGSGWFVALGFAALGLLALAKGRRDLAVILAAGTLAFPMEWALKYFTSSQVISIGHLVGAIFNVNGVGLDNIADFPAGHALRATVFYGLAAFCVARLAPHRKQGMVAYSVAMVLIGAFFVAARPPLLPEDARYMRTTVGAIVGAVPELSSWLRLVFWVLGATSPPRGCSWCTCPGLVRQPTAPAP